MGKAILPWVLVCAVLIVPIALATTSPFLAWRDPVYVIAGFAGIVGLAVLLVQPLLAGGLLPGVAPSTAQHVHRVTGAALVLLVVVHVGGLWITSPPDVIDALLFASPTPFSVWGVIAMWAVFCAALLARFRRRLGLLLWRRAHTCLAGVIVVGTVVHAVLIEGAMETLSKAVLCALVILATGKVVLARRVWRGRI